MADFSTMLKYLRQREGLSQRQLASKLKMSASAIGMYESGKRIPRHEDEEARESKEQTVCSQDTHSFARIATF